jgi:hypothetical protein
VLIIVQPIALVSKPPFKSKLPWASVRCGSKTLQKNVRLHRRLDLISTNMRLRLVCVITHSCRRELRKEIASTGCSVGGASRDSWPDGGPRIISRDRTHRMQKQKAKNLTAETQRNAKERRPTRSGQWQEDVGLLWSRRHSEQTGIDSLFGL